MENNSPPFDWEARAIGKIVKSNTHVDYVCQVYSQGEVRELPQPDDYSFGTFVAIDLEENGTPGGRLVGIIYNTLLMNPDFGSLGPRLSPRQELEVFTPDYLAETATLVGIIAVGRIDGEGQGHQGVPSLAAIVNNAVHRLSEADLRQFHRDPDGRLCLRYVPLLMSQNSPLTSPLLLAVVDRLAQLFPDQQRQLALLRNNLAWKSMVEPVG